MEFEAGEQTNPLPFAGLTGDEFEPEIKSDTMTINPKQESLNIPIISEQFDPQTEETKQPENENGTSLIGTRVDPAEDPALKDALSIADRFLKKLRMPPETTASSGIAVEQRGTPLMPFLLDESLQIVPNFEFIHTGSLRSKGPTFVLNQILRHVMNKEDLYINWAKLENIHSVNRMVAIVLADVNGIELYERIVDGRLSSLKNVNNKEHSVVFDLPKQDEKKKFWSKMFDCPRIDKDAILVPNSFKGEEYLLSPEDMKILDFPSELNKEAIFFTQTELWPPVPKTPFNRIISLDCEMVITRVGFQVARITLVDEAFQVIYDSLVLPPDEVTDWVTEYTHFNQTLRN